MPVILTWKASLLASLPMPLNMSTETKEAAQFINPWYLSIFSKAKLSCLPLGLTDDKNCKCKYYIDPTKIKFYKFVVRLKIYRGYFFRFHVCLLGAMLYGRAGVNLWQRPSPVTCAYELLYPIEETTKTINASVEIVYMFWIQFITY